jgi:threonine dehydrogenase-like Zn-dependent dehydrogenase
MRAVRLTEGGLMFDQSAPKPMIAPGESLIRVNLAGICSTDLEIIKGYYGFAGILGHEFVGVVEESSESRWQSRRVVCSINFADPKSEEFIEFGLEHHPHRTVMGIVRRDGAMADYVAVPTFNLFEVPDEVTDAEAVFTEPLAAALRIAEQLTLRPSQPAAVIGPGRLGLLVGQVLAQRGAEVTLFGRSPSSVAFARSIGMVAHPVDDAPSSYYPLVVDCSGNPVGLEQALRITRPRGTLVLKSTYAEKANISLTKVVVDEIQVLGSRCGPMGAALRCLARREVEVQKLIEAQFPIEQAIPAFALAAQPGIGKVLLSLRSG